MHMCSDTHAEWDSIQTVVLVARGHISRVTDANDTFRSREQGRAREVEGQKHTRPACADRTARVEQVHTQREQWIYTKGMVYSI